VQGDSNALARSASTAVAEDPGGTNYNPLLIYGGVGLGKTHLAQAIANYSADKKTAEFICYASGEEFTSEFIQSIRDGKGNQFSKKYRGVDLLILDDIQFLEGKEKTQEEFFHLFNTLYQHNKQIVLCADRLPQKISGIEERVLSRFEWGLSTDVQQPSLETRLAILHMKADALSLEIEQEVLDLMAESITTNVRQLEGAVKQLSARAKLMDVKVDIETARRLLKDQIRLPESSSPDPEDVLNAITSYYSSSREELTGQSRREELVYPRHVAMYFCRKLTSLSLSAIGARFGGRDHSTVSHACKKVSDRLDVNPQLEGELEDVKREIQSYAARS
jgi:chromosomal replication initiator protein